MKILLGDFNAKVGRADNFNQTIGNDREVRLVNFATFKNLRVKSMMFPHQKILNLLEHLQI
jgi:hypothetical protein